MTKFTDHILNQYGLTGKTWLELLPTLTEEMALKYGLSQLVPVSNLSCNYVMTGFQKDQAIVLKLVLNKIALQHEALALQAFEGFGAAQLIAQEDGVLLLERAVPGNALKSYFPQQEDAAIRIAANLIKRLHQATIPPQDHTFPHLSEWLAVFDQDWAIPSHTLQKARDCRDHLLETSPTSILLHGDLHHDNILQNGDDWIAIDPKGVMGDPAYDTTAFIHNPIPILLDRDPDQAWSLIQNRARCFAQSLDIPLERILSWCFVKAVLCWIWDLEDGAHEAEADYFRRLTAMFEK
jgi:streptomycin 6-kinase